MTTDENVDIVLHVMEAAVHQGVLSELEKYGASVIIDGDEIELWHHDASGPRLWAVEEAEAGYSFRRVGASRDALPE